MQSNPNRRAMTISGVAKDYNLKGWYDDDHRGSGSVMRASMWKRKAQRKVTLRAHRTGR